jgi:hypothetical protein
LFSSAATLHRSAEAVGDRTFATSTDVDQYGVMTAAHRLGHSNASVTSRHYARPVAGRDDQVAEASDGWFSGHDGAHGARRGHDDDGDGSAGVPARL